MRAACLCLLASLSTASVSTDAEECTYALEVLQVQDGSSSFSDHIETMRKTTQQLVDSLRQDFGEFRYGVTSFVDKPIPMRGVGYYGNFASLGVQPDWCFRMHAQLSQDPNDIAAGLASLGSGMGSGGDYPENPYEGMLFAAYNQEAGWSAPEITHAESGRPISRIMIMFTDDVPHLAGDAYGGTITAWNWPREYSNPEWSTGGFGSRSWGTTNYIYYRGDQYTDRDDYIEMANLFRTVDLGSALSTKEEKRLNELIEKFGPYPWPNIIDHPGDDSLECNTTEYPTTAQLGAALKKFKITPIILLARPTLVSTDTKKRCASIGVPTDSNDVMDCLVALYTNDLEAMGVYGVVDTITSSNVLQQMLQAISTATEQICINPTTTPAPTTQLDTTEETASTEQEITTEETTEQETTGEDVTTDETAWETTDGETTEAENDTTNVTEDENTTTVTETESTSEVPKGETTTPSGGKTDSDTTDSATAVSTTSSAYVTDPATTTTSESKKSPIAVIAGATGGAIAGVAGVAGLLYKKFGLSMFGGQSSPGLNAMQQVETPESPVERETMEEVTMDMFQ